MSPLIIYGATGYTGGMASLHAKSLALNFMLAGRSEAKTKGLAASLNVPYRIFDITAAQIIDPALKGISVVLNCAGPFMHTAEPLMRACIRTGAHYLDIAAELDSYRLAEELDEEAKRANVMLMPGCGGSVAMLGCLVGHVLEDVANPTSIEIALHVAGSMSRGSAITAAKNMTSECLQRLNGELVPDEAGNTRHFDFDNGKGKVAAFPVTLPDLITIWRSTGVADIRTFVHASGDAFPTEEIAEMPDGPTAEQREASPYHAAVMVSEANGSVRRAVLHTVNGYTFTGLASVEAAKRVLGGQVRGGFQTPAIVFGNEFVETIADSVIKDL
ncbi:hypothetical protein AK830_g3507 [Neonectria ditissima]|uniref:Saccharopine dehydrogenase NADP binding domain-containing protein n=1 Tax=Neonectria ditissima TaxID=78410 RepID=A0A0P7BHV2_9HYPO|nr:hypothetical protein AK830_g3507 [Neonectria ditissima]